MTGIYDLPSLTPDVYARTHKVMCAMTKPGVSDSNHEPSLLAGFHICVIHSARPDQEREENYGPPIDTGAWE